MASDIEIAQAATPQPITQIADKLQIPDEALDPYGHKDRAPHRVSAAYPRSA